MTTDLHLLRDIAQHLNVKLSVAPEQIGNLITTTDIRKLADEMKDV